MKILELQVEQFSGDIVRKIFVGNEFSPDPMEVQVQIKALKTHYDLDQPAFSTTLDVYYKPEKIHVAHEDVLTLLRKAGYVEFNAPKVRMFIYDEDSRSDV